MKINEIEVRNFYSFQDLKLSFEKYKGIILIDKKNKDEGGSNGAGGSSIFEAVVYGLFGRTIRKSTEDSLVNNRIKKDLYIKIKVNDNCIIERTRRPASLRVWVEENELTKESMQETQKVIEEILNINYKVFVASFVFGQHSNFDFLNSVPDDKRLIIKSFLNLDDLFDMRDKVKDFKSQYTTEIKSQTAIIEEYIKNIKEGDEKLKLLEEDEEFNEEWEKYSLEDILKKENEWEKSLDSLSKARFDIEEIQGDINRYKEETEYKCKVCGSVLSNKNIHNKIIPELLIKKEELQKTIDFLEPVVKNLKPPVSAVKLKKFIRYKSLRVEENFIKKSIDEMSEKAFEAEKGRTYAERNYDVMRFWEKAFSEQGLIKYVIRNILDYFNIKCNYYLSFFTGDKFLIKFDDSLNEKIYIKGKKVYHSSLSGGESRKVNLAIMLGLQSLLDLTTKEQSDILFLDEIAVNLDDLAIDGLYILLQELNKTKTLFIITHNKYLRSLLDSYPTLKVIKKNGVSKVV